MYALVKPHFSQFGETGICPAAGAVSGDSPRSPLPLSPRPNFDPPVYKKKKFDMALTGGKGERERRAVWGEGAERDIGGWKS